MEKYLGDSADNDFADESRCHNTEINQNYSIVFVIDFHPTPNQLHYDQQNEAKELRSARKFI